MGVFSTHFSIITLIFSHSDHCAIKILKKFQKKIFKEKILKRKKKHFEKSRKKHTRSSAGMEFPALYTSI